MSGIYSVEDLLKLRASPLICKPSNLPAIEDLLSTQESTSRRAATRGKSDDANPQTEPFPKRPLLDSQQKKSSTDPDRIVLGPPRRSFASSTARPTGKIAQDGVNNDGSDTKHHDRRNTNQVNGRFTRDQDGSQNERPRRRHEEDDGESKPRRDHERDRPRWAAKDEQAFEDEKKEETGRPGGRRDLQSRAKFEQPWFRHDRGADSLDETKKEGERQQEWRRDRGKDRDRDRDRDRQARPEADPEWMDAPDQEEPSQVHTQEEFQRWKERMKAGSGATEAKPEADIPAPSSPEGRDEKISKSRITPAEPDDSMDKFLARFNEAKTASEPKAAPTKAPTKTRFASLFSPPPETQFKQDPMLVESLDHPVRERSAPIPATVTPSHTDADQAGFARILEMLQTRNANPSSPQTHESRPKTSSSARDSQHKSEPDGPPPPHPPPGLMAMFGQEMSSAGPARQSTGADRAAASKSPTEPSHGRHGSNKDELLLNLLRQANLAPKPTPMPPQQHDPRLHPAMFGMSEPGNRAAVVRNQMVSPNQGAEIGMLQRREMGRSIFDEASMSNMRYPDEQAPHEPHSRRHTNGAPPPFFDDAYLAGLGPMRQGGQPQPPQPKPQQQLQAPPPGLARPPGFDQMPRMPQGWPSQQAPPAQQQSTRQAAPPGMASHPRSLLPQYGPPPPNMGPHPSQNQPQSQRPPQRQFNGDPPGIPNFPPGMGPPPGFMNNGPPPGFPSAPPNYARFQGGEPPLPPPPPQQHGVGRAFMEMYGDGGRMGMRGGSGNGGGMPGYK